MADVGSLIRSEDYRRLLILSAAVGLLVSLAAWCFLTVIPWIQDSVFQHLPSALGFDTAPWWWPLPVLAVAGVITAFAIVRLPGRGDLYRPRVSRRGERSRSTFRASSSPRSPPWVWGSCSARPRR
jgi:hypothetical protein